MCPSLGQTKLSPVDRSEMQWTCHVCAHHMVVLMLKAGGVTLLAAQYAQPR